MRSELQLGKTESRKVKGKRRPTLGAKSSGRGGKSALKRGILTRNLKRSAAESGRLPKLGRRQGCSAALVVVEHVGRCRDRVSSSLVLSAEEAGGGGEKPKGRKGGRQVSKHGVEVSARVCRAMAALGHAQRLKILRKLLDGPAMYQALKRLTKLKAGPLYHHINQLRLAGLIFPKQRDLYELTRAGRNTFLGIMVLAPLTNDSRRRPTA